VARLAVRLGRGRVDEAGEAGEAAGFDWEASAEHCRMAYLRGLFLARGSLSLASGRTHLEFVVPASEAPVLAGRLDAEGLPAAWRLRRGRGVVTWKSADTVGLFLRRIGAGGALLELEARQVARALRGDLNRVLNAESANLQRAVGAAGRQIAAIDEVDADGRLAIQPPIVRMVADARRETPEATLGELAERLNVHRSTVQRALERIEHLALHPDEGIGRRVGRSRTARSRPGSALA
jgi:DNA-binding protein WhiA